MIDWKTAKYLCQWMSIALRISQQTLLMKCANGHLRGDDNRIASIESQGFLTRSPSNKFDLSEAHSELSSGHNLMKVRLLGQQFINILPTIVAIWFALWPQRARDAPPAIRSIYICVAPPFWRCRCGIRVECWICRFRKKGENGNGNGFCPRPKTRKFAVTRPVYVCVLYCFEGREVESFRVRGDGEKKVTQFISFGARHKSSQQQAANRLEASSIFLLLAGRSTELTKRPVIYDFVNLVHWNKLHQWRLQQTAKTSSLPKSFVLHAQNFFLPAACVIELETKSLTQQTNGEKSENKCG